MCMETNLFEYFGLDREDSDRVFIIAEMSANHNHDFNIAVETVKAAKAAGADAIKFQTYTADTLTLDCDNAYFQIKQDTTAAKRDGGRQPVPRFQRRISLCLAREGLSPVLRRWFTKRANNLVVVMN